MAERHPHGRRGGGRDKGSSPAGMYGKDVSVLFFRQDEVLIDILQDSGSGDW